MHEAGAGEQCRVQGGCGWGREEGIMLVAKGDGALRAQFWQDGLGWCSGMNNARIASPILTPAA